MIVRRGIGQKQGDQCEAITAIQGQEGDDGAWPRLASLFKFHPLYPIKNRDVLKTMRLHGITKRVSKDGNQKRCRGDEKTTRAQAEGAHPLQNRSLPT